MWVRLLMVSVMSLLLGSDAGAQGVSSVRAFGGGVAPLFNLSGREHLYIDNQGTQGYMYTFGSFETYNFRNPTTGQAWSGALGSLGPQLTIGLIQGAVQAGAPVLLPPPPRITAPLSPIQSSILDEIP